MNIKTFLFFTLICKSTVSVAQEQCSSYDVDESIRSVTASHGLLIVENISEGQQGSCVVNEVDNLGFTIIAATSEGQKRVDCEVTILPDVGLNEGWQLLDIQYTQLQSYVSPLHNLSLVTGDNSVLVPTESKSTEAVSMKLLLWIDTEDSFGTLTIKSLTFNGGSCSNLSSALKKVSTD